MQKQIYYDYFTGGWIVEYRYAGESHWTRVGIFGSKELATQAYSNLK